MPKKDIKLELGKHRLERVGGKYILDGKPVDFEDLLQLKALVQQLIEAEHSEVLEEMKARGEKIYREVRADGTVVEY